MYIFIHMRYRQPDVYIYIMKNKWKSAYAKIQTTDLVQNISFFFIDRTFPTEKIVFFPKVLQKRK